jgi:hypothetical protein
VTVVALFVDGAGIYPKMLRRDRCYANDGTYPEHTDDARRYVLDHPVVAHPPCNLWVNMAAVNWKRYGRQRPAWYPGGDDGGCFASALASVRRCGGVLEHPAGSHAWRQHGLRTPSLVTEYAEDFTPIGLGWTPVGTYVREYVCEVWQSAYGHRARKRTWLLYCGKRPPFELNWAREPGTHQIGWFDREKPTLSKRDASATPEPFARELIRLAEWSRG